MSSRRHWPLLALAAIVIGFPLVARTYFLTRIGIVIAIYALNSIGMTLLVRYAGVISIGHAGFFAVGAYVSAILSARVGLDPLLSVGAAAIVTVVAAYVFAIPFLTLRLTYLAMATLAFGEVVYLSARELADITGGVTGIPGIPYLRLGPIVLKEDWKIFYLTGGLLVAFAYFADNLGRSRVGRALHAIRTNELAARAMAIDVQRELAWIFCFSALLSGVSGAILAHFITFISPESFTILFSITLLIIVIIGGASVWGGLVTAVVLTGFSEFFRAFQDLSLGSYGLVLVLALFLFPEGLARSSRVRVRAAGTAVHGAHSVQLAGAPDVLAATSHLPYGADTILELDRISKRFGGTQAVAGVSLTLGSGQILGLIGPNGAGKTTLLNIINGFVVPEQGRVVFCGEDMTALPPHQRARVGVARTFQITNLFRGMTVIENVMVGCHRKARVGTVATGLAFPRARREEADLVAAAREILAFLGLADRARLPVESLPYGDQKLVELARALAMEPVLVLLDEPASGLNHAEMSALSDILRRVRGRGISIVLVEHNMPLVMEVSDSVLVLNFGRRIAFGGPDEISGNDEVIKAYLGRGKADA